MKSNGLPVVVCMMAKGKRRSQASLHREELRDGWTRERGLKAVHVPCESKNNPITRINVG